MENEDDYPRVRQASSYRCPTHGDIGDATLRFQKFQTKDGDPIDRTYCMACVISFMDSFLPQVELIEEE